MAMKRNTIKFIDKLVADPKLSATEAYMQTHTTNHNPTARVNASVLLAKPEVLSYMESKSAQAEKVVISVMTNAKKNKDSVQWQRLAHDSAQTILDRVHGRPLTKTTNTNINVNVETAINSLI